MEQLVTQELKEFAQTSDFRTAWPNDWVRSGTIALQYAMQIDLAGWPISVS